MSKRSARPPPKHEVPFFIVSGYRFHQHAEKDLAVAEAERLSRETGRKFWVYRVDERISVSLPQEAEGEGEAS